MEHAYDYNETTLRLKWDARFTIMRHNMFFDYIINTKKLYRIVYTKLNMA